MSRLILKRNSIGQNPEDFDVLEDGAVVGRIFRAPVAPSDREWMWASGHSTDSVAGGPRLRSDARGGDGGVQVELGGVVRRASSLARPEPFLIYNPRTSASIRCCDAMQQ
jgi:hypothetical protein